MNNNPLINTKAIRNINLMRIKGIRKSIKSGSRVIEMSKISLSLLNKLTSKGFFVKVL